jgi:N-acyl homoserine lactone hydrolase
MKDYRIKFFANAMGPEREKSKFTYLNFCGHKVNIPYFIWYIEGAEKNIIVDSGCSAEDYSNVISERKKNIAFSTAEFKDVQDIVPFEEGLRNIFHLSADEVDIIILTHLHWDHCLGVGKCKNAKLIIQEDEWKSAYNHHALFDSAYAPRWFYQEMRNIDLIRGDVELFPGIRVMLTPGHTPGGQAVVINTKKGEYAISGSCVIKDNFYPPEEIKRKTGFSVIAPGVHTDSLVAYENTLKLVQVFGDRVLPCHEAELMKINSIP